MAPAGVNGTYRGCDHVVLGTVSNWGGTAFELAAWALYRGAPQAPFSGKYS